MALEIGTINDHEQHGKSPTQQSQPESNVYHHHFKFLLQTPKLVIIFSMVAFSCLLLYNTSSSTQFSAYNPFAATKHRNSSEYEHAQVGDHLSSLHGPAATQVEGFSRFAEVEGAEERAKAFLKLDPIVRTFKPRIADSVEEEEDSQENTATHSPIMSSAQKSGSKSAGKSVSKFAMEDLESMISSKSEKKEISKTPVPMARQVCTRAKTAVPKRKKPSSSEGDWFSKEKGVHDHLSEVMESIRDEHENAIKELQQALVELRTSISAKDKAMIKMKKDYEGQLAAVKAQADETVVEATEEAKTSALKSLLQARIKIVEEALDPAFDRSTWELTKWKNALADMTDGDEEPVLERMDMTGPSEAGGADVEVGSLDGGEKQVGDEGCIEKA